MGRSGTTSDLEQVKRVLRDVAKALKNFPDEPLGRLGREADRQERNMDGIIRDVRRNWKD